MTKLATISLTTKADKQRNIQQAMAYLLEAADKGADWLLLPEIFAYHGSYDLIYEMAEEADGPLNQMLAAFAQKHKVVLIAGSVGERPKTEELKGVPLSNSKGQKRVFNTTYVFDRNGNIAGKYRKTHLFNLLDANNQPLYCESEGFIAGGERSTINIDGYHCGLSICYDLRFPLFFQKLAAEQPLDVLLIPSAFTKKTGEAHWELLLRARAVELQCYVYASNQTGEHSPGKESFGHGMVVDPWGIKLCDTGTEPGIAYADMTKARIDEVRAQLPALKNARPELY